MRGPQRRGNPLSLVPSLPLRGVYAAGVGLVEDTLRRGGACPRPLFDMCPCRRPAGVAPYRHGFAVPPPPPGEAEAGGHRPPLRGRMGSRRKGRRPRRPAGGRSTGARGRLVAAPTGPPCHCEERSDAAIRCPSSPLCRCEAFTPQGRGLLKKRSVGASFARPLSDMCPCRRAVEAPPPTVSSQARCHLPRRGRQRMRSVGAGLAPARRGRQRRAAGSRPCGASLSLRGAQRRGDPFFLAREAAYTTPSPDQ